VVDSSINSPCPVTTDPVVVSEGFSVDPGPDSDSPSTVVSSLSMDCGVVELGSNGTNGVTANPSGMGVISPWHSNTGQHRSGCITGRQEVNRSDLVMSGHCTIWQTMVP